MAECKLKIRDLVYYDVFNVLTYLGTYIAYHTIP